MTGQDVAVPGASVRLRREPWDCDQLGIEAGKVEALRGDSLEALTTALSESLEVARRMGLAHLAARVDATERDAPRALQANGFQLVDTVVSLSLEVATASRLPERSGAFEVRWAEAGDADRLADLSADAFSDSSASFNRYLNDGGFTREQIRRVYGTWARTSVGGAAADATLVAERDRRLVGFLTLRFPGEEGVARVPLNAVEPSSRGQGVYRGLVAEAVRAMSRRGARHLEVTTQLQQLAVQRTWWRLGAKAVSAAYSFHRWLSPDRG